MRESKEIRKNRALLNQAMKPKLGQISNAFQLIVSRIKQSFQDLWVKHRLAGEGVILNPVYKQPLL